jgi:hypothetical protein
MPLRFLLTATAVLSIVGCGSATVGALAKPAAAKWENVVKSPDGGSLKIAIYYGPWQCSTALMSRCQSKCASQGHAFLGCMWLADFKGDWQGRYLFMPAEAGGRLAITHCCCDYPTVPDLKWRRETWNKSREGFRETWSAEFGPWPTSGGKNWAGHHIHDLAHGGAPTAPGNVLPVPADVHDVFNRQYPACYARGGQWSMPGPERPYTD